jgi:glycosyltransferase involved in cell wall biosynthesis
MRIGIIPILNPSKGGVYQYSLSMLRALYDWKNQGCEDEFVVFAHERDHPALLSLNGRGWAIKSFHPPSLKPPSLRRQAVDGVLRILGEGSHREALRWLRRHLKANVPDPEAARFRPEMSRWFRQFEVDVMLYPAPHELSFETRLPYVMAIHDLQHRLQPEFPEVSAKGEWERREYLFRNGSRCATLLLADSEVGKEDILNFYGPYGVTPDRVKVLPFLPPCYLALDVPEDERQRVRTTYHLPERYLFYPAQFWPHKNHARIVKAIGLLKQEYSLQIPLVLAGSNSGEIREQTFNKVMSLSSQFGLEKEVRYLGYVQDEDMSSLYAEAAALVMPTFFGPTNIPVLEAWAFGCPVLTSDIRGIREQVTDAAILVDPRSVEAIADGIYRIWTDETLCCTLAQRGQRLLAAYTPDDYRRRLIEILEDAKALLRSEQDTGNRAVEI